MPLSEAQRAVRATGIGSSEIGAVAGLSPWAAPIDVWCVKRGLAEVPETDAMRRGTALEPVVADLYAAEYLVQGERLYTPDCVWRDSTEGTLRHGAEPWILASPDRVVIRYDDHLRVVDRRLVEIKTASFRTAHHWGAGHDQVPPWYRAQIEWQMLVTGVRTCDLVVLFGVDDLRVHRIEADDELAAQLVAIGRAFWCCVERGEEPSVDGTESYRSYLEQRFPRAWVPLEPAPPEAEDVARELADARRELEAVEQRVARAENQLLALLGEREGFVGRGWKATWKAPAAGSVSWKAVAEALGAKDRKDLITANTAAPSRRFRFTTKEE